ncbi:hypothetical protein LTS10_004534 [Elasticomyces elasticus]|nr:hypothetical protein LTS10_004534 [Elasticomyces elasticus]
MASKDPPHRVPAPPLRRYRENQQDIVHYSLFQPTNSYFYDGKIRTLSGQGQFDLPDGWDDMLRSMRESESPEYEYEQDEPDEDTEQTRLCWFEVAGHNVQFSDDPDHDKPQHSSANWAHHLLVMNEILPALRKVYGKTMRQHVIIFVPYERQRQVYNAALDKLLSEGWTWTELPEVWTITAASEPHHNITADVAILDLVKSKGGFDLGFLKNDDRAAIMFTRGRKALIVVSGDLYHNPDDDFDLMIDPYVRKDFIRREAKRQGRTPTSLQLSEPNAVTYYHDRARCGIFHRKPATFAMVDMPRMIWPKHVVEYTSVVVLPEHEHTRANEWRQLAESEGKDDENCSEVALMTKTVAI